VMFSSMILNMLYLNMPTMDLYKGEFEDSDNEEEVLISWRPIEITAFHREIIEVGGR